MSKRCEMLKKMSLAEQRLNNLTTDLFFNYNSYKTAMPRMRGIRSFWFPLLPPSLTCYDTVPTVLQDYKHCRKLGKRVDSISTAGYESTIISKQKV